MKMPKCPKTVSGKHVWQTKTWYSQHYKKWKTASCPTCFVCGMIDDRKVKND